MLITGLDTSQGLFLARAFKDVGCKVIGADELSSCRLPIPGWRTPVNHSPPGAFSTALHKFYYLPRQGTSTGSDFYGILRYVIKRERVSCWISCASGYQAIRERESAAKILDETGCRPVMLYGTVADRLRDNDQALNWLREELDLQAPQSHTVRSRDQAHRILSGSFGEKGSAKPKKPYLLRRISNASANGNNINSVDVQALERPISLPKRTTSETYETLSQLPVSPDSPFILTQDLVGKRYHTVALLVHNEVRLFVAYELLAPDSGYSGGLKSLPKDSAAGLAMLKYNQSFASRCSQPLTGHVTFEFAIEERATVLGTIGTLYATAVRAGASAALALLAGRELELVNCYLSAEHRHGAEVNGLGTQVGASVIVPAGPIGLFWGGYEVLRMINTVAALIFWQIGVQEAFARFEESGHRLAGRQWKDAIATVQDPLPAFWLYHVYWPLQLVAWAQGGRKWSKPELGSGDWVS